MRKPLPIALAAAALAAILGLAARVRMDASGSRELLPHDSESPIRSPPAADPDDARRRQVDATPVTDVAAQAGTTHANAPARPTPHADPLTIRGRVLDAQSGRPLPNAWVERSRSTNDEREVQRTDCDAAGAFELADERGLLLTLPRFEGDGAPRTLRLRAGSPGFPAREFHISAPSGTRELELRLPLPRGITLHGLVVDLETGAPIAGAEVSTALMFASDETRTDARGAFELDVLVEAAGFEPVVAAVAPGCAGSKRRSSATGATSCERAPSTPPTHAAPRPPTPASDRSKARPTAPSKAHTKCPGAAASSSAHVSSMVAPGAR